MSLGSGNKVIDIVFQLVILQNKIKFKKIIFFNISKYTFLTRQIFFNFGDSKTCILTS